MLNISLEQLVHGVEVEVEVVGGVGGEGYHDISWMKKVSLISDPDMTVMVDWAVTYSSFGATDTKKERKKKREGGGVGGGGGGARGGWVTVTCLG